MSEPIRSEPIEALLFDLGGVVIDIDFGRVFAAWSKAAGVSAQAIRSRLVLDEMWHAHECGRISDEAFFTHLRTTLDLPLSHAQFVEGWNAIFVGEVAGIGPLLQRAATVVPVYAFSNTNRVHELCWSERFRTTLAPFRQVFVSSTIGLRKPDREAFDHVTRSMGVPAGRVLFFDDLPENVIGARAAGLQATHVRTHADTAAAVARVITDKRAGL
jgi:putative hydrolase of the HAD superfamily